MRPCSLRIVAALASLVAMLSCRRADSIPGPGGVARTSDSTLLAGLNVSAPVANAIIAHDRGVADASAALSGDVSYVSLLPGTVSDGTAATVTNLRTMDRLTVVIVDGGFDPQPISASLDDTIQVTVSRAGGPDAVAFIAVAASLPPRIVRTRPPRGQTDVPLNMVITIVFSEPVAPATVKPTSVTLSAGESPVAGEVHVLPGPGYTVEFTPSMLLAPLTTYTLRVSSAVTNLAGSSAATPASITFTTSSSVGSGSVASVEISPDVATINVGQQFQLTATLRDSDGRIVIPPTSSVYWTSSAPDVANPIVPVFHLAQGTMVGIGPGTVVITARSNDGHTGTARITVNPATTPVGAIVLQLCDDLGPCGLYAVDPDGSNGRFLTLSNVDVDPVWSPDGRSIAFRSQRGCDRTTTRICHNDLYVMKGDGSGIGADGSGLRSLTSGVRLDVGGMSWSPDGKRIVFSGAVIPTDLYLTYALYVMNADGSGLRLLVSAPPNSSASFPDWSPDGSKIAYDVFALGDTSAIYVVDPDGSNNVRISAPSASNGDLRPHWSPDGKRIAFTKWWWGGSVSKRVPLAHAFVMGADGSNVTQISHDPNYASDAAWSPDGTKLATPVGNLPGLGVVNLDGSVERSIPLPCCVYSPVSWRRVPAAVPSVPAESRARP